MAALIVISARLVSSSNAVATTYTVALANTAAGFLYLMTTQANRRGFLHCTVVGVVFAVVLVATASLIERFDREHD